MNDWRPTSGSDVAERRAGLIARARQYFSAQGVLAVDTPAIGAYPSVDHQIEAISIQVEDGQQGFLHTSPEVTMKRLLAAGYPDIYTICRVYRAREHGSKHLPEFTIAEWYRHGFDLGGIIDDTIGLIAACLALPELQDKVDTLDYATTMKRHVGVDPLDASTEDILRAATDDDGLRGSLDRDAALDLLLGSQVAKDFPTDRLTVLQHYPASQAALARLCADDARVADRFEVYCGELELANGYVELTDPGEQAERLADRADLSLIAALKSGLPECAGVSVGIERLQMVLDQAEDIRDVVTFPPALI